jgi:polysaccharide export outer membrane protein
VNPDGLITVPYAGDLYIRDKTKDEAQKFINETLRKYYKDPEVIINIDEYKSSYAYINGAVRAPQAILLSESPVKLIDFILRANPNPAADTAPFNTRIILRRDKKIYRIDTSKLKEQKYDVNNLFLKKNDVIFVERNKDGIYVFGEVGRPGLYVPHNKYSITELLANAGISQLTANPKKIFVIRENLDKFLHVDVYKVDVSNPVSLITARNFYLKPNDIVFMPAKGIAKWNRVVSLLTPSTDLFKAYNPVIQSGVASQKNTSNEIRY